MIVIDASVLVDLLLGRPEAGEAVTETLDDPDEWLHAPALIEAETLNALRRHALRKTVSDRRAGEAVADLGRVRVRRYPHEPLRPRVWELRRSVTACDASYLALAELLDESVLLTGDRGLATQARRMIGRRRVRLVA